MGYIKVSEFIDKDKIIDYLNKDNPLKIWNLWENANIVKNTLTIKQLGAGNGKTYGLWQDNISNKDKRMKIFLANTHSEKDVILNELREQAYRKELVIVENVYKERIEGIPENTEDDSSQHVIKYKTEHPNDGLVDITIIVAAGVHFTTI